MKIFITSALGTGRTILSAFDNALRDTGVYNYNLIPLSSVIPPQSELVRIDKYNSPDSEYGHKLYVVKAEMRSNTSGEAIAAGIGWYQFGDDNRGVFVEHETIAETEELAKKEIHERIVNSLHDLCDFRNIPFDESNVNFEIVGTEVSDHPACALVLAVYKAEGWE